METAAKTLAIALIALVAITGNAARPVTPAIKSATTQAS